MLRTLTLLTILAPSFSLAACGRPGNADDSRPVAAAPAREMPATEAAASVAAPAAPAPVTGDERAGATYAIGLKPQPDGQVMNDCGEAVTPDFYAVELGGDVGRALLVVMKGGPNTLTCYDMTGMQFALLKSKGRVMTNIMSGAGHFAPMETTHQGVKDVAVGGPGFEFPVYEWTGVAYEQARTIPDTEFPASVN